MDYYELLQPATPDRNSSDNTAFVNELQQMINRLNECDQKTFQEILNKQGVSLGLMVSLLAYGLEYFDKMASFLLTTGIGAVLNAASFIGGSYLAQYLTGKDQDAERKRHDLAIEQYQKDYNEWKKQIAAVEQWKQDREEQEGDAALKLRSTDEAFRLYKEQHPQVSLDEPNFNNYYKPSKDQRNGELIFTGVTVAGLTYGLSKVI